MSTPAGEVIGEAQIQVDANTDPASRALQQFSRDAQGRLRDVQGRFVSASRQINGSLNSISSSSNGVSGALGEIRGAAISLAPALIPVAASVAAVAVSAGAAAVAVGVFGAALGGQLSAISEAADAEEKYAEAVEEHGASSKQAAEAQNAYVRQVQKMPPATREAAAALSSMKDQYEEWSNSLAADTVPVATKAIQVLGAVFPKLTPVVQGASGELDRFVTIVAGSLASPGLDRLFGQFGEFSTGVLKRANDALVQFLRTVNTDTAQSGFSEFLAYVRENGPVVRDTVQSVVQALLNVARAASDVGPGLLSVVSVLADIVAAVPPGVITTLLQLALAIRAVRLAAAAGGAISTAVTALAASFSAMSTAAAGATGILPRLGAAFMALSRTTRLAVAGTGIGLLVIALTELSQAGRDVPPDVDELTQSLADLGKTGVASGEAARAFGQDLSGLYDSVRSLTDPTTLDNVQQFIVTLGGLGDWDSTPVKEARENVEAVDQSLANLVSGGRADLAAAALTRLSAAYGKGGRDTAAFKASLDDYQKALDNVAFEQSLVADSMGVFGQQALLTKQKLDEQKQSADGLSQAVNALNNAYLQARGGIRGLEAAIDAATESFAKNGQTLDENTEKGRANNQALDNIASATIKAAEAARENGASWAEVNAIYERGRAALIQSGGQMETATGQARRLADQILKTPDKTAFLRGDVKDLEGKLKTAREKLRTLPDSRQAQVRAEIDQLERQLASARRQLGDLPDAVVGVSLFIRPTPADRDANGIPDAVQARAKGGLVGYAHGGLVRGPGSTTSDNILLRASRDEFVMRAAAVRKYGLGLMEDLNAGRLGAGTVSSGSLGVGTVRGQQVVNVTFAPQIKFTNEGVIGSQFEMENWLVRSLDSVARAGRIPRSVTTGV